MSRFLLWIAVIWLGVGLTPIPASIIWSGTINHQLGMAPGTYTYSFDINNDEVSDFVFRCDSQLLYFDPVDSNAGIAHQVADGVPVPIYHDEYVALSAGSTVGSDLEDISYYWWAGENMLVGCMQINEMIGDLSFLGSFMNTDGYLGVSFEMQGETHYGWIRLSHDLYAPAPDYFNLTIREWAWETESDTPIAAGAVPEPSSALLALIGGVSVWFLRRQHRISKDWKES
jgi:hypothetical protein